MSLESQTKQIGAQKIDRRQNHAAVGEARSSSAKTPKMTRESSSCRPILGLFWVYFGSTLVENY